MRKPKLGNAKTNSYDARFKGNALEGFTVSKSSNSFFPLILGLDLEGIHQDLANSGINFKIDRISEIGAVLWDWKFGQPVKIFDQLINEPDRTSINEEIEELTGISDQMLNQYGRSREDIASALRQLNQLIEQADFIMAHNAREYDRPMLEAMYKRHCVELPPKIWIDSATDIEYPKKIKSRAMAMLEHSHGFINPFPHRAVTDALAMLKVAYHYNVERMVALAKSPLVKVVADFNAPNWRNRQEVEKFNIIKNKVAKGRFKWDPDKKIWFKKIHKILLDEKNIDFDFNWYIAE